MLEVRQAEDRGHADHGWLNSYHTFSFGGYHDPSQMGFRSLRVINEDRVAPGRGFGTHGHSDMEIVSYVLDGALQHKDSMGNGETLRPGEFQRITAGTGITHSEFNPAAESSTHFYQIWLFPESTGLEPGYEQKAFDKHDRRNRLQVVAAHDVRDGSLKIHQDAAIFLADIDSGHTVVHSIATGRHAWLQVLRGSVQVNDVQLASSDGLAVSDEDELRIVAAEDAEVMLFDLA